MPFIPGLKHIQRIQQLLLLAAGNRNVLFVGKDHLATVATNVFFDVLRVHQKAVVDPKEMVLGQDICLLYTSDAADERSSVDLGGRRIIKKKKNTIQQEKIL